MRRPYQTRLRRERAAKTREQIVATARALFAENAYADVSMCRIAAVAGLTTGAVYTHFAQKTELFEAAVGQKAPLDRPSVRFADELEDTLRALVWSYKTGGMDDIAASLADAEDLLGRVASTKHL
jgi:AcrR family transcriptional regulator